MRKGIISSDYIAKSGIRFEGKYYLNENSYNAMVIEIIPEKMQLSAIAQVFNPGIFKRQFCKNTANSVQYFQSSDVQNSSESSSVFVNRNQAAKLNLLIKKGDILVTGFGSIGQTRLVSKHQDNVCYANNVCRIRCNEGVRRGYIYAFLSSKYGHSQLNKNASGSVVRYIESPGIRKTLIPDFPKPFQTKIDDLIQESARLREEATDALNEAHIFFDFHIDESDRCKVSIRDIISSFNCRFEGSYFVGANRIAYDFCKHNFEYKTIKDLSIRVFKPNIFKREYVKSGGHQLIGGADMLKAIPKTEKQISKRQVNSLPDLKIKRNYLLISRAGTVGYVAFADNQLKDLILSEDVLRIIPVSDEISYYLYGFLSSKVGQRLIKLYTYGSVIQHIESQHLEQVPIPILDKDARREICSLVKQNISKIEIAKEKELQAISMVEQEIEKWNN